MKRTLFASLVLLLCGNAEAATIIGNSVAGPYQPGTRTATKSVGFTTGSCALFLDDIQVVLNADGGFTGSGGTLTFTLNADTAGNPGGVLATIGSQTVAESSGYKPYTITPASPLLLAANTPYWIQVVIPDIAPEWSGHD